MALQKVFGSQLNISNGLSMIGDLTVNGNITGTKIYNAVYNDYAEYFLKDEKLEIGDIVCKNINGEGYIKSKKENSRLVVGVVSSEETYAQCIGGDRDKTPKEQEKKYSPIALAGRVPVKVIGKVEIGQFIVSSSITGVGKGTWDYIPGCVVGKALEKYDNEEVGKINILVMNI